MGTNGGIYSFLRSVYLLVEGGTRRLKNRMVPVATRQATVLNCRTDMCPPWHQASSGGNMWWQGGSGGASRTIRSVKQVTKQLTPQAAQRHNHFSSTYSRGCSSCSTTPAISRPQNLTTSLHSNFPLSTLMTCSPHDHTSLRRPNRLWLCPNSMRVRPVPYHFCRNWCALSIFDFFSSTILNFSSIAIRQTSLSLGEEYYILLPLIKSVLEFCFYVVV